MPRTYSATVRRQIVARLRSGEAVAAIASETGIAQATLFRWKRQALIDSGVIALVNNAVNMAVANRNRRGATILHADHGTQFTSWSFGENIRRWGLLASFGTVGDGLPDNAAMESFWARLQVELLNTRKWATTLELAAAMADYIDNFYNIERRHSYLGNISPTEFETLWTSTYSVPQLA